LVEEEKKLKEIYTSEPFKKYMWGWISYKCNIPSYSDYIGRHYSE